MKKNTICVHIRMTESRRMRQAGHVACIREKKNIYRIFVG
jgi:hypothetical protein